MATHTFKKTIGIPAVDESDKDYTYYWQLWHHNWDDLDIETIEQQCELADAKVLEVGCGDGRITFALSKFCKSIVGIDLNADLFKAACNWNAESSYSTVTFELMDAEQLAFPDESFDVVLFPCVLQMVNDPLLALREAHRVLKRNGQLLVIALLQADYDDIIEQFAQAKCNIEPEKIYEQPLIQTFGASAVATKIKRDFKYYFESKDIAQEAFQYALDRWYGGIKLNATAESKLLETLSTYQVDGRVCLTFPSYIYTATRQ